MSLPSHGYFIKNNEIVGRGACNVGWSVAAAGLLKAMREAWTDAIGFYDVDYSSVRWREDQLINVAHYFTARYDLIHFEYFVAYGYKFPKELFVRQFQGDLSTSKLDEMIQMDQLEPVNVDSLASMIEKAEART